MVCKYLSVSGSRAICTLNALYSENCPKTKLKIRISQKCWQIKSDNAIKGKADELSRNNLSLGVPDKNVRCVQESVKEETTKSKREPMDKPHCSRSDSIKLQSSSAEQVQKQPAGREITDRLINKETKLSTHDNSQSLDACEKPNDTAADKQSEMSVAGSRDSDIDLLGVDGKHTETGRRQGRSSVILNKGESEPDVGSNPTYPIQKHTLQSPDPAGNFFQNRKPYHTPKSEIPIPADDTYKEVK